MIDDHEINAEIQALSIGDKIRKLREKKRYSLKDLVAVTGLEKDLLSQIEANNVVPPVATLLNLAKALNTNMTFFFQDSISTEKISVTRHHECVRIEQRPHHEKGEVNYFYEALETKKTNKHMEPFLVEFKKQDTSDMVFVSHDGEEFLYLLEGSLEFRSIDRVEVLDPGDSIYFESDISHSFRCLSEQPAKAIVVLWSMYSFSDI